MPAAKTHILSLSGNLGLRDAPALVAQLQAALAAHSSVTIETEAVTDLDIAVLQALVAAQHTATAAGKTLALRLPGDGALRRALTRAGFLDQAGAPLTPEAKIWTDNAGRSQGKAA